MMQTILAVFLSLFANLDQEASSWAERYNFVQNVGWMAVTSRHYTFPWNEVAGDYIIDRLESYGYDVEIQYFDLPPITDIRNIIATREGTTDDIYILGAHLDSVATGPGADDDASGCSLLLETARVFSYLNPEIGLRFIFFNAEEEGLVGSIEYKNEFAEQESENWLGMIQFDMILYDRDGTPDYNIQHSNIGMVNEAMDFANQISGLMSNYGPTPNEVYWNMCCTDSMVFRRHTAAISIRECRRHPHEPPANPNWHQPTDAFALYSDEDYDFGFELVQQIIGSFVVLTNAEPRFTLLSLPDFIDGDMDVNGDDVTDLRDFAKFQNYYVPR